MDSDIAEVLNFQADGGSNPKDQRLDPQNGRVNEPV